MAVNNHYYATHYSESELSDIATYLERGVGKNFLSQSSRMKTAVMAVTQNRLSEFLQTLDNSMLWGFLYFQSAYKDD